MLAYTKGIEKERIDPLNAYTKPGQLSRGSPSRPGLLPGLILSERMVMARPGCNATSLTLSGIRLLE